MSDGRAAVRMRVLPGDRSLPPIVARYLLPQEHLAMTVRFHPAQFIPPVVTVLGALSLAIAVSTVLRGAAVAVAWLITLVFVGNLLYTAVDWLSRYLVITSYRIFLVSGSGITLEMQLADVKDVRLTRSIGAGSSGTGRSSLTQSAWWLIPSRTPNGSIWRYWGWSTSTRMPTTMPTARAD